MQPAKVQFEEFEKLFKAGQKLVYDKGEMILRARDEPRGVYFIETGFIKVYSLSRTANEHTHLFYGAGDIFPVIWAFRNAVRNVFYQALETTTVWVVPKDEFLAFVQTHADAAFHLLEKVTELFHLHAGRIDNLLYSDAYEKVVCRLLSLTSRFGKVEGKTIRINFPITQEDLASSVGLTRETASRMISRLHHKGLVSYDSDRHFIIHDLPGLIKVLGEDMVEGMWPDLYELAKT